MKRLLLVFLFVVPVVSATPFCDASRIDLQKFVEDAFCMSARKGQNPRVEIALENTGANTIPFVELVAVSPTSKKTVLLDDEHRERPWLARPAPGYKRRFTLNPLDLGDLMWTDVLYVRPRYSPDSPECEQKLRLPSLIDCHNKQPIRFIGEGLGFVKPGSTVNTSNLTTSNTSRIFNVTNNKTPAKSEPATVPVRVVKVKQNVTRTTENVSSSEPPTGMFARYIMDADLGTAIGALVLMGIVLGLVLSGSYALEHRKVKKKEKEEGFIPEIAFEKPEAEDNESSRE